MKKRVFYLDFIRVIAFFIIIVYHFNISVIGRNISDYEILPNRFANGSIANIGVSLFFILSGAALVTSYSNGLNIVQFYKKRAKSMLPMFWLSYIIVFFYYFFRYKTIHPFTEAPQKWRIIFTLIGLDGYTTSLGTNYYLIGEWFLGCILLMYLLFPLLFWGLNRYPYVMWIPVLAIYIVLNCSYFLPIPMSYDLFMHLPEFIAGMYIGKFVKRIHTSSFFICLIVLVIGIVFPISFIPQMYLLTIIGILAYIVVGYIGQMINNHKVQTIFIWLSKYSYSVYLLHHVVSEQIISTYEGHSLTHAEVMFLFILVFVCDLLAGYAVTHLLNKVYAVGSKIG